MKKKLIAIILTFVPLLSFANSEQFTYGDVFKIEQRDSSHRDSISLGYSSIIDDNSIKSNAVNIKYNRRYKTFGNYGVNFNYLNTKLSSAGRLLSSGNTRLQTNKPTYSLYGTMGFDLFHSKINSLNKFFLDSRFVFGLGVGLTYYDEEFSSGETLIPSAQFSADWIFQINPKYFFSLGVANAQDKPFVDNSFSYTRLLVELGASL